MRQLRRAADLTQVEVAERLGVPQSFVSKYETGERRLDVIELSHVATAIGTTLADVVGRLDADDNDDAIRPSLDDWPLGENTSI
ncbi:MAG: helix-turn-helix domain-containing protein [Mycobacterium sp.]